VSFEEYWYVLEYKKTVDFNEYLFPSSLLLLFGAIHVIIPTLVYGSPHCPSSGVTALIITNMT